MGCKFGRHFEDWVPYGSGNIPMPGFECEYEGSLTTAEVCREDESCPAYEPVPEKEIEESWENG